MVYEHVTERVKIDIFMMRRHFEESFMELFVNEQMLINSNRSLSEMSIVHEGITAKLKTVIDNIIAAISKLWNTFLDNMDKLFSSDKEYLEKHKDTILKNKVKGEGYTMYNYFEGLKNIDKLIIVKFDQVTMVTGKTNYAKDIDTFLLQYFKQLSKNKDLSYIDEAKSLFRGSTEPIAITADKLDMTLMYDFCHGFGVTKEKLKKDMINIENAGKEAIKELRTVKSESSDYLTGEKFYYSFSDGMIVNEATPKPLAIVDKKADTTNPKPSDATNPEVKQTQSSTKATPIEEPENGAPKKDAADTQDETKLAEHDAEIEMIVKGIEVYITVSYGVAGAKLAIVEEAYKNFMSIIRDHVISYKGTKEEEATGGKAVKGVAKTDETTKSKNAGAAEKGVVSAEN